MESLATDKHSSLLRKSVKYGRKKFYNIGPWLPVYMNLKLDLFASVSYFLAYPNICKQGWNLPEWSPSRDSTLVVDS